MPRTFAAFAVVLALAALSAPPAVAAGVGFQHLTVPDPEGGQPVEVGVWYPTDAPGRPETVGSFRQTVATDAAVKGERLPLVVISHGTGGGFGGHSDTAHALAEAGFVAAALTHTGDNWRDQSRATQIWNRPRQLKLLVDYMLARWPQHGRIDGGRLGAFGFSAGGFTVLAAAGGEPDLARTSRHCEVHPGFFECRLLARVPVRADSPVAWTRDPRIKAVVSAAPALGYAFGPRGLADLRVPVQLWRAAEDGSCRTRSTPRPCARPSRGLRSSISSRTRGTSTSCRRARNGWPGAIRRSVRAGRASTAPPSMTP